MSNLEADVILILHFAFVLFVLGGLVFIWIGHAAGWRAVRDPRFRLLHLAAILFVAAESLLGVACPLTLWEDALRGNTGHKSFVARWVHRLMFYNAPEWVFTILYVLFALVVAATLWWIPPKKFEKIQ
jgi:hypothetical protein